MSCILLHFIPLLMPLLVAEYIILAKSHSVLVDHDNSLEFFELSEIKSTRTSINGLLPRSASASSFMTSVPITRVLQNHS